MRAEDLKEWLRVAEEEEWTRRKGETGFEGAGDRWGLLVKLCKHIWHTGEIPQRMLLAVVVLIPKGTSSEYRGISLLEVIWKLLEQVLDAWLLGIDLHDYLHGFWAKRGCGAGHGG